MSVVLFFLPQGQIIGGLEEVSNDGKSFRISNPAMVIARDQEVMLAPLLHFTEEKTIQVDIDSLAFGQYFTPIKDLENHYNQMFGSGLVIANGTGLRM